MVLVESRVKHVWSGIVQIWVFGFPTLSMRAWEILLNVSRVKLPDQSLVPALRMEFDFCRACGTAHADQVG